MNEFSLYDSPVLYSLGTRLAYKIDNEFYSRKHFVWCTIHFHSDKQAPSSNPYTLAKRFLSQVLSGDRHDPFIKSNAIGILRGAKAHFENGTISPIQYNTIKQIVSLAEYKHFMPILYIIDTKKVAGRVKIVESNKKANNSSVELIVEDLKDDEFEIIDFSRLLDDYVHPYEGRYISYEE